jgi:hypothetical protein
MGKHGHYSSESVLILDHSKNSACPPRHCTEIPILFCQGQKTGSVQGVVGKYTQPLKTHKTTCEPSPAKVGGGK